MKWIVLLTILSTLTSCGLKISSMGSKKSKILSGSIVPFTGLISSHSSTSFLVASANAAVCADPVYAKLFLVKADGSIDESAPISSQLVGSDAIYSFDVKSLGLVETSNVSYLIKAEGCNNDIYKRPVTSFDNAQNIDAKTTIISEVVNAHSLVTTTLNQASRSEVQELINSLSGTSVSAALNSLTSQANSSAQFISIFGASPSVVQDAKPDIQLVTPGSSINELAVSNFSISAFHVDPAYSFAYSWKLDGVVKSTASSFNYIPGANDSGFHNVTLYVGKDDGTGHIDLGKPYYTKILGITVNNSILPVPPNISLHASNPSPVNITTVQVNLATGVGLINCASFSSMAITDTSTAPGISQFTIDCTDSGTQDETVSFSSNDGPKTFYLWAMDNEGNISAAKTTSLVLDTLPPTASLSFSPVIVRGGSGQSITLSGADAGVGLSSLALYFSDTGAAPYTLVSNLSFNSTSYAWSVPSINTTNGKFKLVATDLTGLETITYSGLFEIDSTVPSAPVISRTSSLISNSTTVNISTTCTADYNKIIYSENSSTPALADGAWENCATTKNFTVSSADGAKTIYAFTRDLIGNISPSSNITMTLDKTAPSAPLANLSSAAITSSAGLTFTITDCLDHPFILVSESIIAPAANDGSWQACSTTASAITHTLIGPVVQGTHNLYVFSKDSADNISPSTFASVNYDTTNPVMTLSTTLSVAYRGGEAITFNFSGSDANGLSAIKLEYAVDGTTFVTAATLAGTATTHNWTIPSDNTVNAKIRFVAVDNALTANTHISASTAFSIDSILPVAPGLTRTSPAFSNSSNVTLTVSSCTDTQYILIQESATAPAAGASGWQLCTTVADATTATVSGEGVHNLYAWAKDAAGNVASSANFVTMTLDTIIPALTLNSFNTGGYFQGGSSQNITWTASDANLQTNPISIYYSVDSGANWISIISSTSNTGTYSWSVPVINNDTVSVKIIAIDKVGQQKTVTSAINFSVDSIIPIVDSFSVNGGVTSTTNNNVLTALTAHDTGSPISFFCIKYDVTIQPTLSDSCWKNVTAPTPGIAASQNITFSNYYFQLGFNQGDSNVYVWVKDSAGNISENSGVTNTDKFLITFNPGTPPSISAIQATNTDTPSSPVVPVDLVASSGSDIYIKWNASDAEGLDSAPIDIHYTTNDTSFTAFAGGNNLINGANGACTVDPGFTGCAKLVSPSNGYFKVRVIAKDTLGTTIFLNASPMNETKLKVLAGNTDDGINGSAASAIFNVWGSYANVSYATKHRLVVSEDGKFFYIDQARGLLWIDPSTGILKKFINTTGTSSGDGGAVSAATLNQASAIALDFTNNLLIWDFNRIRKVNLATMTITTLIGGGASADPLTTVAASTMTLGAFNKIWATFIPMPNGDIIFGAGSTLHQRKFRAADNKVELIDMQGSGFTGYPTDSWATPGKTDIGLIFDSTTSQIKFMSQGFYKSLTSDSHNYYSRIDFEAGNETTPYPGIAPYDLSLLTNSTMFTGLDGQLYMIDRFRRTVYRYNYLTNTRTLVLGVSTANSSVPCANDTLATSCILNIDSLFVSKAGRIYFVDNGLVRTIDNNNNVITLFGQFPSFGDGGLASVARFGGIQDISMGKSTPSNNKVIVEDSFGNKYREFTIDGSISYLSDANYSYSGPFGFDADPVTGDIFSPVGLAIKRFVRTSSTWVTIIGGGATSFHDPAAEGALGLNINLVSGYNSQTSGFINNKLYLQRYYYTGSAYTAYYIKGYDASDSYRQSQLMGNGTNSAAVTVGGAFSSNPTNLSTSKFDYFADPTDATNKFFFTTAGSNKIYSGNPGGNIQLFATIGQNINSFTHKFNTDGLNLYFCSTGGFLYKYIYNTAQTVQLPWLSPTIRCKASRTIIYNSERNSLIFPFSQNGLFGVGEYDLNP